MATRVRSYSKINLGLAVGPTRPDGFHGLATVYQTLALHDIVTVTARLADETTITLTSNHPGVPRTETRNAERNTAYKMVAEALAAMGLRAEVHIDIHKTLPVQGGMGAGSANAAAALIGLEKELNQQLAGDVRLKIAGQVGSDVPLFLVGGTVLGKGRGEVVSELPDLPATHCVVALPKVGVSTPQAFRDLDAKMAVSAPSLTSDAPVDKIEELSRVLTSVFMASDFPSPSGIVPHDPPETVSGHALNDLAEKTLLALVRTGIENDFEDVAFSQHPFLRDIKRQLMGSDSASAALCAALSGSGSALFGLYRSQADAVAAQQRVQQAGTQAILTETLPRPEYWERMFAE